MDEALGWSPLVLECFAADGHRCLRGLDEEVDVRWQLTDSNAGILVRSTGIVCLPTITDLSVWRSCASRDGDLQSERLRAPALLLLLLLSFFFHTSPLRLPHTLISARAERGYSLNQQPGRKCEERRAGCIIDFGLKRRIQVWEVYLIGGVPLCSDLSPVIPHQINNDKHE